MDASALLGAHESPLNTLNTADVALVLTLMGYLVLVRMAQAVI
jgi:hypothetical protein